MIKFTLQDFPPHILPFWLTSFVRHLYGLNFDFVFIWLNSIKFHSVSNLTNIVAHCTFRTSNQKLESKDRDRGGTDLEKHVCVNFFKSGCIFSFCLPFPLLCVREI